nr:MAG TPA: hypothetical protein [Caudoviricetes sp.]
MTPSRPLLIIETMKWKGGILLCGSITSIA